MQTLLQFFTISKKHKLQFFNRYLKNWNKTGLTVLTLFLYNTSISQTILDTTNVKMNKEVKGVLLDFDSNTPLPYANIVLLHKNTGTITNEKGEFKFNITALHKNDTLSFQYIGYDSKNIPITQLDTVSIVYLKENTYNLNEIFVFTNDLNAESIVRKVLKKKESNYKRNFNKSRTFIRKRFISDINNIHFDYKKSSFPELNEEMIKKIERKIPKHSVSFTDFLGDLYFSNSNVDSLHLKVDPIKMVSLKDKNLADVEQLESLFENLLKNTEEKEYWKIKSGILGGKIDYSEDTNKAKNDSLKLLNEREFKTKYYRNAINYSLKYSSFNNKKDWDFLYHTGKYEYTLVGGTVINGEDVYVIDFTPKKGGKFEGRVYIAIKSFALIRADYEYGQGKTGTNINLFGIGYTKNVFNGSISFEKKNDLYQLKYCSKKVGIRMKVDRNISLIKKRKRFLLDKKLDEVKVRLNLSSSEEYSFEILVLDQKEISNKQFKDFKQKEFVKLIYVDQFDDQLWNGYSIIEPTKQMREYKKQ
ncbi:MAG: carboxypeptidase-like regulatory domain-containing protein [Flavobacteriaceae bacterium]|nr:carboxypeptidase-like regulatory domain-containing protein [Flavobacteriaceae bacterium]